MTITWKLSYIILTTIVTVSCEGCFQKCLYDMLELKEKIIGLENALNKFKNIEEELEIQKNKTRQLEDYLEVQKNKTKGK